MDDDEQGEEEQDEEIRRLELEQAEFDNRCQENTNANSAMVTTSPISLETDDTATEEEEEEPPTQQQHERQPVYGSLASTKPTSKSEKVRSTDQTKKKGMHL